MQLRFVPEPENGSALVRDGLSRMLRRPKGLPQELRTAQLVSIQVKQPHAVYDLHADEIANGEGLESAHETGFRYLVYAGNAAAAAAEVQTDSTGKASLLANINFGTFVEGTARALAQLTDLGEVGSQSYEVRLLRFSAIAVVAIWLRSDSPGKDIVYPLAPTPDGLKAEKPYEPDDFLAAIRPLAKRREGRRGPLVP